MSKELKVTINNIFSYLSEFKRLIANRRRKGLMSRIVITKLRALGLDSPVDLVQLYSICDGTETSEGETIGDICLFPGFYWLTLDDASVVYKSIADDRRWNRSWLPIFANGGGDFFAVICDKASPDFGSIVNFRIGSSHSIVEFASVTKMFQTIEKSFRQDAFFETRGFLEANYEKMKEIARATQPDFVEHQT